MSKLLALLEMLVCLAGINICFGLWSVKQERIVKFPYNSTAGTASSESSADYFTTAFVIGLSQTVAGLLVGLVTLALQKVYVWIRHGTGPARRAEKSSQFVKADAVPALSARDVRQTASMGFTNAFGTSLGYAAMRRLPYPVALAAKMSKMVPVMVVGFLWYGTRYPIKKVASCLLLTLGVVSFYLLKDDAVGQRSNSSSPSPKSNADSGLVGFTLILINLIMDGFTNSTQDELVRRRHWSSAQLMVCANGASTLWLCAMLLSLEKLEWPVTHLVHAGYAALQLDHKAGVPTPAELLTQLFAFHDLSRSLAFLDTHRGALKDLGLMSLMNALGQIFIFRTIASFGGLAMTGMTLVRKAGSIVLSIFIHGHVLNGYQWIALAAILAGVIWDGWQNISGRSQKHGTDKTHTAAGRKDGHQKKTKSDGRHTDKDTNDKSGASAAKQPQRAARQKTKGGNSAHQQQQKKNSGNGHGKPTPPKTKRS